MRSLPPNETAVLYWLRVYQVRHIVLRGRGHPQESVVQYARLGVATTQVCITSWNWKKRYIATIRIIRSYGNKKYKNPGICLLALFRPNNSPIAHHLSLERRIAPRTISDDDSIRDVTTASEEPSFSEGHLLIGDVAIVLCSRMPCEMKRFRVCASFPCYSRAWFDEPRTPRRYFLAPFDCRLAHLTPSPIPPGVCLHFVGCNSFWGAVYSCRQVSEVQTFSC